MRSIDLSKIRPWASLPLKQKQGFINKYCQTYKTLYPGSKTNVSLQALKMDMTEFNDAPSLFGIFYEDLRKNTVTKSRLSHDKFWDLLIEEKIKKQKASKGLNDH
jgi:hypothetical protein